MIVGVLRAEVEGDLGQRVVEQADRATLIAVGDEERGVLVERVLRLGIVAQRIGLQAAQAAAGVVQRPGLVAEPIVTVGERPRLEVTEYAAFLEPLIGAGGAVGQDGRPALTGSPLEGQAERRCGDGDAPAAGFEHCLCRIGGKAR